MADASSKRHHSDDEDNNKAVDSHSSKLLHVEGDVSTSDKRFETSTKRHHHDERSRKFEGSHSKLLRVEDDVSTSDKGLGSVVASHYNKLEEKGRDERKNSRIFYMRNFNNWIKSYLISQHLERVRSHTADDHRIVALDLGCGKGGDLLKWSKGRIRHLICVDIASTSVAQCQERYDSSRSKRRGPGYSAEFFVADCTKKRIRDLKRNPGQLVDIVSCQFVFHYSFESEEQAEMMIQNVAENLQEGGYFIGTMPNSLEIMSKLKASGTNSFGNEVFRIEFPDDRPDPPPTFGDKYNFFLDGVVDCPEFLVDFTTMEKICRKHNLELVNKEDFNKLYKEMLNDRDSRYLMNIMKALETYPHTNEEPATKTPGEYDHAEAHLKETGETSMRTLSKSEWEVVDLYMSYVFRKTK